MEENEETKKAETPQPPKAKKIELVPIKLIRSQDGVVLIEWVESIDVGEEKPIQSTMRGTVMMSDCAWIPGEKRGTIPRDVLNAAVPYGVDWEAFDPGEFDARKFAADMRAHKIWTADDLLRDSTVAVVLLQKSMGLTKGKLFDFVKAQTKNGG